MGLPRWAARIALRVATGLILAFIYVPIGDHRPLLVQRGRVADLADPGVHARLVRQGVRATRASATRSLTSVQAALGATIVALVLGSLLSLAVAALPVLRPRDDLVRRDPAARAARHRDRHRPQHGLPDDRLRLRAADDHRRPRHVLRRGRLQQRDRPAATHLALVRGGVGGPRRRHVHDVPPRDVPGHPDGARSPAACWRSPCRSTRSSSRTSWPGRATRRCRSGSSATTSGPNQLPLVNVAAVLVLIAVDDPGLPGVAADRGSGAPSPGAGPESQRSPRVRAYHFSPPQTAISDRDATARRPWRCQAS